MFPIADALNIGLVYLYKDYFSGKSLDFIDSEIAWIEDKQDKLAGDQGFHSFLETSKNKWIHMKAASLVCHREHSAADTILRKEVTRLQKDRPVELGWMKNNLALNEVLTTDIAPHAW